LTRPTRTPNPHRLLAALALATCLVGGAAPSFAAEPDAKAIKIANKTLDAMGGKAAWDAVRFVRFRFAGFRYHFWDKWDGRHRVEFTNRQGDHYVILENIQSREGRAWKNGVELVGEEGKKAVEAGYGTWINDTYWLFMPYKLQDPGVTLTWAGEETIDGQAYDKLHLSFAQVGLTPGDQYWAYINRLTGLMDRWAYKLQDYPADREPTVWLWRDWQGYGGIQLAPTRYSPADSRSLPLEQIAIDQPIADSVFTDPTPLPETRPAPAAPKP
jgi:hypothetical protein